MSIVGNRFYNDPNLAAAFSNLASAFAPASGADMAGYATAQAQRAEADRIAQLFAAPTLPGFDRSVWDLQNIANGGYVPTQSFAAQDQNTATAYRGQDINARTALSVQELENQGALARLFATPTIVGQGETALIPQQMQAASGLPAMFSGAMNVGQGEVTYTADGRPLVGQAKPLNESEALAAAFQSLPVGQQQLASLYSNALTVNQGERAVLPNGGVVEGRTAPMTKDQLAAFYIQNMDPRVQSAFALSDIPVETILEDGVPTNVFRPDSVGETPAPPASASPYETQNYTTQGGQSGTAYFEPTSKRWIDTQTREEIPANSITYNSSLQGGTAETGLGPKPTMANTTSANQRRAEVTRTLSLLDLYENILRNEPGSIGLVGALRGTAQDIVATVQDMVKAFGEDVPGIDNLAGGIASNLQNVAPEMFTPSIPEARFLQGALAYALARTENPSGEVSRQAYESALNRVQGGALANSQSALAASNAFRNMLNTELEGINVLDNPGAARTDTAARMSGAPPPTVTADPYAHLPHVSSPDEARSLPPGSQFVMPDGRIGTVPPRSVQ